MIQDRILSVYLKADKLAKISTPYAKKELPTTTYNAIVVAEGIEIVVYEPNQIKSTNNDGSFDIDDDNIYS